MAGFRSQLNRLINMPGAASIGDPYWQETSFEVEYYFKGRGNYALVRPILVNTVVIFLVNFPEQEECPMALVYNKKDAWSDIEKESTTRTEAVGAAIENYYSRMYLSGSDHRQGILSGVSWEDHLLN